MEYLSNVLRGLLLGLLVATLGAQPSCGMPDAVRATLDRSAWTAAEAAAIERGVATMGGEAVPLGAPADVRILHRDQHAEPSSLAGQWNPASRVISLWPDVIPGDLTALEQVAAHEVGHALGGHHVCTRPGELPDALHPLERCSPVGFGPAVMNPYANGLTRLTPLDLAEIRRARGEGWTP